MVSNLEEFFVKIERLGLGFELFGNPAWKYLMSLIIFFAIYLILAGLKQFLQNKVASLSQKKRLRIFFKPILLALNKTIKLFLVVLALRASLSFLELYPKVDHVSSFATSAIVFLQIGIWVDAATSLLVSLWLMEGTNLTAGSTASNLLGFFARALSWVLVALVFLDNIGVDVTALVAGLGIGGIAVALAVQNILGDLLCSLSIALDEPFKVDDFIIVGNTMGTVEKIGIKSTRIRSLSGEQIILSNSDLIKGQIKNYKQMQERRIAFNVGVTYQTSEEKLAAIPKFIQTIVESCELTRFDRCHFLNFGDSALIYETVYYVLSSDFNVYADKQQQINLGIFKKFQEEEIEFAYPTQTLFIDGMTEVNAKVKTTAEA